MTTYYLSPSGNDANNGLGPDASHATNKPWLTFSKAVTTGSPVVPGDTVYVAPSIYYQGTSTTPIASIGSAASPTTFEGDPLNKQGFKDGSGVLLPPGLVWWTTRSAADGKLAYTSSSNLLLPATNSVKGLTFRHLVMESKWDNSASLMTINPATNSDFLFEDCRLTGSQVLSISNAAPTAARNWTFRRCIVFTSQMLQSNIATAAATADADLTILVEHCKVYGPLTQNPFVLGTSTGNLAGGVRFKGNLVLAGSSRSVICTALRVSTVTPIRMEGNLVLAQGVSGGTAGQVVSDGYNSFVDTAASSNFTKAGTDVSFGMMDLFDDDLVKWGLKLPQDGFLGWTPEASTTLAFSGWTNTAADFRSRTVRPWGTGASIGPRELADIAQDTSSAITGGGANSLKANGAGEVSLFVPVAAAATTITIVTKSSLYGGASYPQMLMEANPALGVTATTATASSAAEQTLTVGPFTPTAAGVVELRLRSQSTATNSATWFDLLAAS